MKTKYLSFILIIFPMALLAYVFGKYATNVPHWDDHALKFFQVKYNQSDSLVEKFNLVFAQHNEHRIGLTRLFSLLIYKIKGTIDFRWLMILGNLSLVGILAIFCFLLKKYKISLLYFVAISFLLFGLQTHEILFWGMASVQNFWVVFLAFLTFYLLLVSDNKYAFYGAIFSSFWAVNTSGNGILVPIIGLLILFYQRRNKELIYWLLSSCIILCLYFLGYKPAPDAGKTHATVADLKNIPQGLLIYLGSMLDSAAILPQKRQDLASVAGLFLSLFGLLFFKQTIFKKYDLSVKKLDLFLLASLFFIAGTALLVTYSRLGYGVMVLFGSKYKIYSTLFFIIFYIVAIKILTGKAQRNFGILAILGTILFNIYSYISDYQQVIHTRQQRICDQFNWTYNNKPTTLPAKTAALLKDVYKPSTQFYDSMLTQISDTTNLTDARHYEIIKENNENEIHLQERGGMFNFQYINGNDGLYLILKSSKNTYIFPITFVLEKRKMAIDLCLEKMFFVKGQDIYISRYEVETGNYQVGVLKMEGVQKWATFIGQKIDIQGLTYKEINKNW